MRVQPSASFNLSRANDSLRKSLERLSSGKRINNAGDDAGGLAVAYKLNSKANRTTAILQNAQNGLSYLQVQDSSLQTAGKIVDRMAELRVMAQDITKNTSDIENYSKEFVELQSQLNQISKEKFNGISLFASSNASAGGTIKQSGTASFNTTSYNSYSRTLITHDSGCKYIRKYKAKCSKFSIYAFHWHAFFRDSSRYKLDLGNVNGSNMVPGYLQMDIFLILQKLVSVSLPTLLKELQTHACRKWC